MTHTERLEPVLQYKPLNVSNFETRFLRLLAKSSDGRLIYTLETASLIHPPEYIALSYHWYQGGSQEKTASISVDGTRVPITESLADALWYSADYTPKRIWADQLCINQRDVEERSLQVQHMGKIYAGAYMVHIWLGPAKWDSDRAMDVCRRAYELSWRNPKQTISLSPQEIDAVAALVRRPYFKRVWIIQELAKAEYRTVLCGNRQTPWTGLEMALAQMQGYLSSDSKLLMGALMSFRRRERQGRLAVPRMLLIKALLDSRRSLATEPRDKIYALLGLTRDGSEVVPAPHYTCSDAHIYLDVARHLVVKQGHTAAILLAARTEERSGLPSWVPNWARWNAIVPPWVEAAVEARREELDIFQRYWTDQSGKCVNVPGRLLETITSCADASTVSDLVKYGVDLSINELERYSMKLAWAGTGRTRIVHCNARVGDWICQLENCILPVVLRSAPGDAFTYVGEVYWKNATRRGWKSFGAGYERRHGLEKLKIV